MSLVVVRTVSFTAVVSTSALLGNTEVYYCSVSLFPPLEGTMRVTGTVQITMMSAILSLLGIKKCYYDQDKEGLVLYLRLGLATRVKKVHALLDDKNLLTKHRPGAGDRFKSATLHSPIG